MSAPLPTAPRPDVGPPMRFGRRTRAFGRLVLRLAGWRIEGGLPAERRFVVIVAPHTSNWDFVVGVFAMFALGVGVHFIGKHTLFRGPLGPVMRWLGGTPVDRSASRGTVQQAAAEIRARDAYVLALSPEGTRRRVVEWKRGFYHIAVAAHVPVLAVWLDYSRRVVGIGAPVHPTGDADADIARLRAFYHAGMARYPAKYAE